MAQEPVKAAIWYALNTYCYKDAIFLAERLHAEVSNEEVLHLLATCYHRSGYSKRAYNLLKNNTHVSIQNKYLYATVCYSLDKLCEVDVALLGNCNLSTSKIISVVTSEFESLAGVTFQLLGNLYRKTHKISKAVEYFKQSLKCNPFLWSSFEFLLQLGEKVDPLDYFKTSNSFKAQMPSYDFMKCYPNLSNLESHQISSENRDPGKPLLTSTLISKPHNISSTSLLRSADIDNVQHVPSKVSLFLGKDRSASNISCSTPSFGVIPIDSPVKDHRSSPMFITPVANVNNSKVMKDAKKNPIKKKVRSRNEIVHSYGISGLSINPSSNRSSPASDTENVSMTGLRRSTRLFGSTAPREIKKQTPKVHFADSKMTSGTRKLKLQSRTSITQPLTPTTQNIQSTTATSQKEKQDLFEKDVTPIKIISPVQQSADGLMHLLQDIGKATQALYSYENKEAVNFFQSLPLHHFYTSWVMEKVAIAYYELGDRNLAEKTFEKVRLLDPYYIDEGMAIFSTILWLSSKESLLSSLAQDLVDCEKTSAVAWCAMANCFSLQKEHDLSIKFLKRAIQLDPSFAYAYTLLGHEYVYTEELDLGLSCFRSALRCNERHYNAWYGIAMIYYKQEKLNLAEQYYLLAIKINPKNSVLLSHLAVTQQELGRPEQALKTIHKAIELNPKNGLGQYHKAEILMNLGRPQEALDELQQLIRLVPTEYKVYFLIGKAYQQLGQPHLAQMNFSWAMSLNPQGTNTTIKEAMNQQHYMNDENFEGDSEKLPESFIEDEVMSD